MPSRRKPVAAVLLGGLATLAALGGLASGGLATAQALASGARAATQDPPAETAETVAVPARALDDRALRAVYLDLMGRPPLAEERATWFGRGRHELLDELIGTEAAWRHWFSEQLYYFLLIDNFRPGSPRAVAIPADLAAGRLDVREAIHRIALSPSFESRNPGADTFVTVVLEQLDGIKVQAQPRVLEIGKVLYDGGQGVFLGQTGSSQADVVRIAMEDRRFAVTFVARERQRLLRIEPEPRALQAAARAFDKRALAYTELVREWMLSADYDARLAQPGPMPNRLFVPALFVDLLGRRPEADEERRMRTALDGLADPGPLRAVLARLLIDSGQVPLPEKGEIRDPTSWVADLFRRLLGRDASSEELRVFVSSFHDPDCRPSTILYAIVSHPDYSTY